jgi:hypothetical protein
MDQEWGGECIVSIADHKLIEKLPSVSIVPNPSDLSHSRILFADAVAGDYLLTLSDMNGRRVHQQALVLYTGQNEIMLDDLSDLSSGIYLVRVSNQDGVSEYLKIIKN